MNHQITYLHCGENLKDSLKNEIDEIVNVVIDKYRKEDAEILREVKALEKRITKLEEEDE